MRPQIRCQCLAVLPDRPFHNFGALTSFARRFCITLRAPISWKTRSWVLPDRTFHNWKPQNPLADELYVVQNRRLDDFETLILSNVSFLTFRYNFLLSFKPYYYYYYYYYHEVKKHWSTHFDALRLWKIWPGLLGMMPLNAELNLWTYLNVFLLSRAGNIVGPVKTETPMNWPIGWYPRKKGNIGETSMALTWPGHLCPPWEWTPKIFTSW